MIYCTDQVETIVNYWSRLSQRLEAQKKRRYQQRTNLMKHWQKGRQTALLYARGNAERPDYKTNENEDKHCNLDCN